MRRTIIGIILIVSICISLGTVYGLQGGPTNSTVENQITPGLISSFEMKPGWPDDPTKYVQPSAPEVLEVAQQISSVDEVGNWVYQNIVYTPDSISGFDDLWQPAFYTIVRRTGDCEDIATLICSLLRAKGVPAENVRVVVGSFLRDGKPVGHAFAEIKIRDTYKNRDVWMPVNEILPQGITVYWYFNDEFFENYLPNGIRPNPDM